MSNTVASRNTAEDLTEAIQVRLPRHLLDRIDEKRSQMCEASPGVAVTRSDAVRALLLLGLSHDA